MSPVIICAFLFIAVHNRGKKGCQIPLFWARKSLKISCFGSCCFTTWWPKSIQSTKHKSVPVKCLMKGWKHKHLVGGSRRGTLVRKVESMLNWSEHRASLVWRHWNSLFMQRSDGDNYLSDECLQSFITEFGGILPLDNMSVVSLLYVYNSTDLK